MRITSSPHASSIEGGWNDRNLEEAQGAAYPVPIVTDNGTIYCFYRMMMKEIYPDNNYPGDYRPLGFVKSIDNGETWSRPVKLIDNYPREDHLSEIYTGKLTYQPAGNSVSERIHLAWSISGGGPDSHQHALFTTLTKHCFSNRYVWKW